MTLVARPWPIKLFDRPYRYRGVFDAEPTAVCRVRYYSRGEAPPVIVLTDLPENPSSSVNECVGHLAPELIRELCPERFEHEEPAVLIEHRPARRGARGRPLGEETWDRVAFASWAPRVVRAGGGRERLGFPGPRWERLDGEAVAALIGEG